MRATLFVSVLLLGAGAAQTASAQDPSAACMMQLKDDPRLLALWVKYPFDPSGQSLEVLSSPDKPAADDRASLSYLATEAERCFDLGADWRKANYPVQVSALLETFRVDALSAMADLYAGKITFGEMAKLRARLTSDLMNKARAVFGKLKSDQEAEAHRQRDVAEQRAYAEAQSRQQQEAVATQQAEAARKQALLQIFMQAQRATQIPLQRQPITTNCWGAGNNMNCTTR